MVLAALAGALAGGCLSQQAEEGKRLQADVRRAIITGKSLGRFGLFALFQEDMDAVPCAVPLSDTNRVCDANVVGRGRVRMTVAERALSDAGRVNNNAVLSVDYPAECASKSFDFMSIDNALPRVATADGTTVWQDSLVRVTYKQAQESEHARCSVRVEVAPALLERLRAGIDAG
jgi:hypothetical protein